MDTFKSYIQPIGDNGIGFLAGNNLITAGHVIAKYEMDRFCFSRKNYSKDSSIYHRYDKKEWFNYDGTEIDIAIYASQSDTSPLELCVIELKPGTEVECHTWVHKGNEFEYVKVLGVVDQIERNFFSCKMSNAFLNEGNSGSPLLIDNKVVGVLHGGTPGTSKCVFIKVLPFMIDMNKSGCEDIRHYNYAK